MATKTLTLRGTADWVRVFPDNRDMSGYNDAYRDCNGAYTLEFDPTPESEQALAESGSQKQRGRKSGKYKLIRKHTEKFDWAGGPPKVTDKDGRVWDFEDNGSIWNGSELELEVDVYDAGPGKGTRLRSVKVLKLAPPPERDED